MSSFVLRQVLWKSGLEIDFDRNEVFRIFPDRKITNPIQDFLSFVLLMQFFCFRDFIGSLMSEQYWQMYEGQQRNKGSDNIQIKSETNAVCDFPQ